MLLYQLGLSHARTPNKCYHPDLRFFAGFWVDGSRVRLVAAEEPLLVPVDLALALVDGLPARDDDDNVDRCLVLVGPVTRRETGTERVLDRPLLEAGLFDEVEDLVAGRRVRDDDALTGRLRPFLVFLEPEVLLADLERVLDFDLEVGLDRCRAADVAVL